MQNYNEVSPTWVRMTITKNIQKSMLKMVWRKGNPVALLVGLQISVQLLGCVQLFVTLWVCSMPGFPVHHQLPKFTQTHVHWVGDDIQPSHPLSSPSPPTFNHSQHQGLFVLKTTWDDPERWYGEGGERVVQDWELMYTCGGFMSIYCKTNTVL